MTAAQFITDPCWADFIPNMEGVVFGRHLPAHEDCSALDVDAVGRHLQCGGTLGAMSGYEERKGQIAMAKAIAETFNGGEHLMIEAGTGVGKSLAYLIPSILWAWTNDTPVIVSTATRNLQTQLMGSDIPRAVAVLGENAKDFKVALLKGRGNYLCLRAVEEYFAKGYTRLPVEEAEMLPAFISWLKGTNDGDLDTYYGIPRQHLTCGGDECTAGKCKYCRKCFVYKARRRAAEAHLVVVNHALVMAEATTPGMGILPSFARLVLDEAHNLETIATEYLSYELSMPKLDGIIDKLMRYYRESAKLARVVSAAADELLSFLGEIVPEDMEEPVVFRANGFYWKDIKLLKALQDAFEKPLIELVHMLHDQVENIEDNTLAQRVGAAADQLLAFANTANFVIKAEQSSHVYWIERCVDRKKLIPYIRLKAAPISVADDLRKFVYDMKDSVILCSATLRVGNDFRYMAKRLGCSERFRMLTAESPFDYFRQALVLAPDCLPDPAKDAIGYADALSPILGDIFRASRARALVLFTSYEMMNAVAARARPTLERAGMRLLVQGDGLPRELMTRELKETDNTVIFGAQSFWEGVDVAGEALSCVVLARLPFAQQGDPIVEARGQRVGAEGGKPFFDYMLPEAVIRFRQGFGRLIRTKTDRGVVVVTDPRLTTRNYGAVFRHSIPTTVHTVTDVSEMLNRIEEFFAQ